MIDIEKAKALAAKIEQKARDVLASLEREMELMQWPAEYRAIMWTAVAEEAWRRAETAEALKAKEGEHG